MLHVSDSPSRFPRCQKITIFKPWTMCPTACSLTIQQSNSLLDLGLLSKPSLTSYFGAVKRSPFSKRPSNTHDDRIRDLL